MADLPANGSPAPQQQPPVSTHGAYSPPVQKAISLGNREYALKHYDRAAEHYGEASELQYAYPAHKIPQTAYFCEQCAAIWPG